MKGLFSPFFCVLSLNYIIIMYNTKIMLTASRQNPIYQCVDTIYIYILLYYYYFILYITHVLPPYLYRLFKRKKR